MTRSDRHGAAKRRVIVRGLPGCGGVSAALDGSAHVPIGDRLGHAPDIAEATGPELASSTDDRARRRRLTGDSAAP